MKKFTASLIATAMASMFLLLPASEARAVSSEIRSDAVVVQQELGSDDLISPNFIRTAWCIVFGC